MALRATHDLHKRRASRNVGLGLVLAAFVAIMFGLSIVKIRATGGVQGFDHVVRPELVGQSE